MKTIDLFCGAGGITEGFREAGFRCVYANDMMPEAIDTFNYNHSDMIGECKSIEEVDPSTIRHRLGLKAGDLDVMVGGPPCQGFSINAPERFLNDPRNKLFRHFERFLEEFSPKAFVFENVPGLLSIGDGKVYRQIINIFNGLGYHVSAKILFAAHYGVPQERWRLIILGSQFSKITHPEPTHYAFGRANFRGGTTMTFQLDKSKENLLLSYATVSDAICDLPKIGMGEGSEFIEYNNDCYSIYANSLRNKAGFTFNHFAARLSKQNTERMTFVKPGGSWRDIPHELLPKGMQRARKSDHTKRYGRLTNEGLSGTIMTKCDPHWGTVFLPDQDRTLTVREAARIQSFPDTYKFIGSRVSQYVQVGNAVPVLMAKAIAQEIHSHLTHYATGTNGYQHQEVLAIG